MTRNETYRSVSLAVLVVLAAAVGAVAATGAVGAQAAGGNNTTNATDGSFYSPSDSHPLNARFRDCCGNTVSSVANGVLNLNIVYGLFDGPYNVDITASGLSDQQVNTITFGNDTGFSPNGLNRGDIIGMDFTGVPAGDYNFTVSVVGGDAKRTVPLEVTGGAANEGTNGSTGNQTSGNQTTGTAGNASVVANPANTGNATAFDTVSVVAGPDSTGNLSSVTVNYADSNASIGLVGGNIASTTLNGKQVVNNSTIPTVGVSGKNLTIGFDKTLTVSKGDRITMNYSGVANPPEPGNYTVGVAVNNGSFQNTTLAITGNNTASGSNSTTTNNTTAGTTSGSSNVSVTADPATAGSETVNDNVSVVAGSDAAGNLSSVTVNYADSNASIGLVGGNIASTTLNGTEVVNNSTIPTVGAAGRNLTIGFDKTLTVSKGDRITMNYSGVANPTEPGNYTVGVAVNNGSFQNTTLAITENTTAANNTTAAANNTTAATNNTTAGTTSGGTPASTTAGTGGGGNTSGGSNGSGQQGTQAGGPGFGIAVAVVALLAAALLAVRRH